MSGKDTLKDDCNVSLPDTSTWIFPTISESFVKQRKTSCRASRHAKLSAVIESKEAQTLIFFRVKEAETLEKHAIWVGGDIAREHIHWTKYDIVTGVKDVHSASPDGGWNEVRVNTPAEIRWMIDSGLLARMCNTSHLPYVSKCWKGKHPQY